jgi:hypothetical protein
MRILDGVFTILYFHLLRLTLEKNPISQRGEEANFIDILHHVYRTQLILQKHLSV